MTDDIPIMNPLSATKIQVFENDSRFDTQRIYEFYSRSGGLDKGVERRNLGTDMHMNADYFECRMSGSIHKCFTRILHLDPKLIFFHPGGNIGMAFRVHVGIDTNRDFGTHGMAGSLPEPFGNAIDNGKFFETFDIECVDIRPKRQFDLLIGLAGPV